jgi:hypothetical protein
MQTATAYMGSEQSADFPSTKKKLGRCSEFSHCPCHRFIEGRIDTWAMQPTQRMQFRMRSCLLAGIWANSKGRRKCRRG